MWRFATKKKLMSNHVLFALLNELRKRDKMRGLSSILSIFYNELNIIYYTGARMVDSFST